MLAAGEGALEFRLGRNRSRETLTDLAFATSQRIPEDVFRTGKAQALRDVQLDGKHECTAQIGIRSVACLPLRSVQFLDSADARAEGRQFGVLYLDSQTRTTLLSDETLSALEAVAEEASFAIEQAWLYREQADKLRMEREMRFAAEMQRALLPPSVACRPHLEAVAHAVPCHAMGGDFYDYLRLDPASPEFSFTLGDVAGKGAPAALLSAMMLGMIQAEARVGGVSHPAAIVSRLNQALCDRRLESRFVTLMLGAIAPDGTLTYCNAGHNPPLIAGRDGIRRLDVGGPIVGLLPSAAWEEATERPTPGDALVIFSDGVSEALSTDGEEFGDARLCGVVGAADETPQAVVNRIMAAVEAFTAGAPQSDDITVMVVRYLGT